VKKANRDLSNLLSTMETPIKRLEVVQRKYSELLAEMKRTEREHVKAKKRADQLQKEKDAGRAELNKVTAVKDKLEKLSRDVTRENKKLKVR
jgi:chromosome segregation ATPase